MEDYYNESGYCKFIERIRPLYLEMNKAATPLAFKNHIRPSGLPTTELPQIEDLTAPKSFISIIIASFNFAHVLERVLSAINEQNYPKDMFEVIVIDDASANHYASYFDGRFTGHVEIVTTYISEGILNSPNAYEYELDRLSKLYPELQVIYIRLARHKTWNRAGAINTASRIARGEILVFLRGDTLIIPEDFCLYVNKHHSLRKNLRLYAITTPCEYIVAKGELIDWDVIGRPTDEWPEWPGSSVRKTNWLRVKGYNEQKVGWGGLQEVLPRMAKIGMVQAIEPRLIACGIIGMDRFTLKSELREYMEAIEAQSDEARNWLIPNDSNWGMVPINIKREYNYKERNDAQLDKQSFQRDDTE